ncbi:MAG: phosphoribosylaminoimidazole-succinocarboxamide synthetase [Wigglesworthia glossinidia]|nr:phosphoribosylaminoimidazole-succinocarboxamide synthetase [Wigglesworthia glossinidia]
MKIIKHNKIYDGKSKKLYETNDSNILILQFKETMSKCNGKYIKKFVKKDIINNKFSYFIMNLLSKNNVKTHIISLLSENQTLVKNLNMFPIECVMRNYAAGSIVKRLKIKDKSFLKPPVFEIYLKNDDLGDPLINDSHCITFNLISKIHLENIKKIINQVNHILKKLFYKAELILVDFKLEFGLFNNVLTLGDEFSLDSSRIWEKNTFKTMDKDIFRNNLNFDIIRCYQKVAKKIGCDL